MKRFFVEHKRFLVFLIVLVLLASMLSVFAFASSAKEVNVTLPIRDYDLYQFDFSSLSTDTSAPTEFTYNFDFYVQGIACDRMECYRYGLQGGNNVYYVRARKSGTSSEYMWLCGATVGLEDNRTFYEANYLIAVEAGFSIPSGFTNYFPTAELGIDVYYSNNMFIEIDQSYTWKVYDDYDGELFYIPSLYAGVNYDYISLSDGVVYLGNSDGELFIGTYVDSGSTLTVTWNDSDIEFYLLPVFNPSISMFLHNNSHGFLTGNVEVVPILKNAFPSDSDIEAAFADGTNITVDGKNLTRIEYDALSSDGDVVDSIDLYYDLDGVTTLVYTNNAWLNDSYKLLVINSGGVIFNAWNSIFGYNTVRYDDQLPDDSRVTISIEYRYGYNNTQAAPTEFYTFAKGESYSVNVPTINGWLSNVTSVSGVAGENTTYTVFYYNGSNDNISPGDIQSAYDRGFNDGFNQGQNNASANPFTGFFTGIWSALVDSFDYVLNGIGFNGITLGNVIFTLVIIVVVGLIVKLLL